MKKKLLRLVFLEIIGFKYLLLYHDSKIIKLKLFQSVSLFLLQFARPALI